MSVVGYTWLPVGPGQAIDQWLRPLVEAGAERTFSDDAVTCTEHDRPALDACIASLKRGDVLVVDQLASIHREADALTGVLAELAAHGVAVRSLAKGE